MENERAAAGAVSYGIQFPWLQAQSLRTLSEVEVGQVGDIVE